jgi:hypothetical protein
MVGMLRSWCRLSDCLRNPTSDDRRLGAVAARRDKSVEIVAAVARRHSMCGQTLAS